MAIISVASIFRVVENFNTFSGIMDEFTKKRPAFFVRSGKVEFQFIICMITLLQISYGVDIDGKSTRKLGIPFKDLRLTISPEINIKKKRSFFASGRYNIIQAKQLQLEKQTQSLPLLFMLGFLIQPKHFSGLISIIAVCLRAALCVINDKLARCRKRWGS